MASSTKPFYQGLDTSGHLKRVSKRFGKMKEITLKRYDNMIWLFVNDNSKCFGEDNKFDASQSKYISLNFDEALEMKDLIDELQRYHLRMEREIKGTDGNENQTPQQQTASVRSDARGRIEGEIKGIPQQQQRAGVKASGRSVARSTAAPPLRGQKRKYNSPPMESDDYFEEDF